MNQNIRNILILAAGACPALAIEPPVEARPIPPKEAPEQAPRAVPVPEAEGAPEAPRALPIPEAREARPYIGVILDPVPDLLSSHLKLGPGEGLVVGEVVNGGPAAKAGLEVNDIITKVDGANVGTPEQVRRQVEAHGVGDEVSLEVIHGGERRDVAVTLGAAPDVVPPMPNAGLRFGGDAADLDGMLGNLPEKHAELMRRALEQGMRGFGQLDDAGMPDNWQRDLLRRMERGINGAEGLDIGEFKAQSSVRLMDDKGSIEMKAIDGKKEVRVFDKAGKLLWEGPYDTEQDKAAVPDDIRERIENVNIDMDFGGRGLRLQMGPERFRPLDQIAPPRNEGE